MAKKKTAVKTPVLKAPILRQALSAVKTAIINFSPSHILFVSYNPSSKDTIVTDIPQNLTSQFVLGEGGGSDVKVITIAVTYINNSNSSKTLQYQVYVEDNELKYGDKVLLAGATAVYDLLALYSENEQKYLVSSLQYSLDSSDVLSSLINCTYDESWYWLEITDPTQPASCTVTFN